MEAIVGFEQVLGHHLHGAERGHEVRVAVPAWHDVPVKMIGDTGACGRPEIHAEVHPLGTELAPDDRRCAMKRVTDLSTLDGREALELGDVAPRCDH